MLTCKSIESLVPAVLRTLISKTPRRSINVEFTRREAELMHAGLVVYLRNVYLTTSDSLAIDNAQQKLKDIMKGLREPSRVQLCVRCHKNEPPDGFTMCDDCLGTAWGRRLTPYSNGPEV